MRGFGSQSSASCVIRSQVDPILLAAPPQRAPPEVGDVDAGTRSVHDRWSALHDS